jgi:hypothetical protein
MDWFAPVLICVASKKNAEWLRPIQRLSKALSILKPYVEITVLIWIALHNR